MSEIENIQPNLLELDIPDVIKDLCYHERSQEQHLKVNLFFDKTQIYTTSILLDYIF